MSKICLLGILTVWPGWAQQGADPLLAFDVASVKPNTSMGQGMSMNRRGSGLEASNVTLRMLITFAYNIRDHQLSGGPGWVDTDRYDVMAKAPADALVADPKNFLDAATEQIRQRTRSLLAERFQLVIRKDTKEESILALVVDKNGAKLQPSKESIGPQVHGQTGMLTCTKVNMKFFAEAVLAQQLSRAVVDSTGLTGDYDFAIKFVPDSPRTPSPGAVPEAPAGPTFLDAMREQLGLKLESRKGQVEAFIIEHAQKASAN